jgi:hypothetical protein
MKFGADTADWLLGLPRLADQATRLLRSTSLARSDRFKSFEHFRMIDKESCAGDLPVPNLPQVDDGNTVGDAALGLLAIASFIIHYWGWQAGSRFVVVLSEMATIRSSGLPPRNAPNGIPRP